MVPSRLILFAVALGVASGVSTAATPKEIDAAVQKGAAHLKEQYKGARAEVLVRGHGIGVAALAGLALLESGTPPDDPSVKVITQAVREAVFSEVQTYHIALCLLYLDRLGEESDVPIIQMLGVRLLAGQNGKGGWSYTCLDPVSAVEERALRTALMVTELKAGGKEAPAAKQPPGKNEGKGKVGVAGRMHAEVEKYSGRLLAANRVRPAIDDNSNTQFAILGVWAARKHGVPVETALDLIERRFMTTQNFSGGWQYAFAGEGSPSMTCAGLLGLATAIGRREERRLDSVSNRKEVPEPKAPPPKSSPKETSKETPKPNAKGDDPFYNPPDIAKESDPPAKKGAEPKKQPDPKKAAQKKQPVDVIDTAVGRGLAALVPVLKGNPQAGRGRGRQILLRDGNLGDRDFYFLWSLERVGIVYGIDKIGGIDWYDVGADELIPAQNGNGSWGKGANGDNTDTAFALLFLARSNLVRDLASRVQKDAANAELRAGPGPMKFDVSPTPAPMNKVAVASQPMPPAIASPMTPVAVKPPVAPIPHEPIATEEPKTIAAKLAAAGDADWERMLAQVRDAKGSPFTQALLLSIPTLEGGRQKDARAALAERLTRMTAETLRSMVRDKDVELRRGAVLAMAMKDDKSHLPDLIGALLDDEDLVVRAAKAGLKTVTGQDFGPAAGASLPERTAAAKAWLEWYRNSK
jgi:hypothetical protein